MGARSHGLTYTTTSQPLSIAAHPDESAYCSQGCYLTITGWFTSLSASSRSRIDASYTLSLIMSLFTCRTCTDPEYSDTPDSTARLALGGVHSVKESVYAPYRRIFLEQETTGPSQWALSDGVNARIANHRKYRPCVLQESVKARRPRRSAPYIYLMATYKGNNVSDLPWFFRFFSFPVSPNLLLHDMNLDGTHFHTTPEWPDGKPQWLIIIPIRTTKIHPRTPPWPASRNLQTVRYAFGPKALDHIASLWGSRSLEWQTMCEDPDFLPRQAALLNVRDELLLQLIPDSSNHDHRRTMKQKNVLRIDQQ